MCKTVAPPKKLQKEDYSLRGIYPIIDQSQNAITGWTDDHEAIVDVNQPVIVFGDHTCVLKIIESAFAQGADGVKILKISDTAFPFFIYFSLMNNPVIPEGYKRHFSILKKKTISLPLLEEQKQISETLSTAQQEIDLLKQLADKYKTQKRGLMQKLLTGEWRVKVQDRNIPKREKLIDKLLKGDI